MAPEKEGRFAALLQPALRQVTAALFIMAMTCCFQAAAPAQQSDMADVQTIAAQRTGFQVMPSGNPQADQTISYAISCLLAEDLSKDEAIQIAFLNNRKLQARLAGLGIAYGDMIDAGLLDNPILDFIYQKSDEADTVASLEWSIALDFINVLTLPMRKCIAASEFEATKLEIANDVLDLAFDVQVAYYSMQGALQTGEMYQKAVEASEAAYEGAKMLHEAGNITDLELHQEQVVYEEQKLNLAEAERDAVELREELNMLMGLWGPHTQWKITSELPDMPRREFQGKGLESIAVYQRLDLAAARQEIETIARELGLENATRLLPELEGAYTAERETDGSWLRGGGVSFPLPIFNQGHGRLQRERARVLQAQHNYYALAVDIRSDVRKAFGQMRKSRDRVQYYDTIMLPLLKRIVEESHLMFNSMDVSPYELLETKRDEIVGKRERIEALNDYWIARSELERAMGGSFTCLACPQEAGTTQNQARVATGNGASAGTEEVPAVHSASSDKGASAGHGESTDSSGTSSGSTGSAGGGR